MAPPPSEITQAICTSPLKTSKEVRQAEDNIITAPRVKFMKVVALKSNETKRRSDKGASFCQESKVPNPVGDNFLATGGTQKWRGVNPILSSTPRKQVIIAAVTVTPPYRRRSEPMLCTTK